MSLQQEALEFGLGLLEKSDAEILPRFKNCSVSYKPDGSELTEADRRAEEVIRFALENEFPEHGILGEEIEEKTSSSSEYRWVIDPIDGTTPFSIGLPSFGTLIALLQKDEPIMGIVHLPAMRETVYAAKGHGCWFRSEDDQAVKIQVADSYESIETSFISSSGVHNSDINSAEGRKPFQISKVINRAKKFRFFGDCTQHALVCRGKIHGAIDAIMQPWDTAAIVPCIREAGGVASTMEGDESGVVFGGSLLTSSSRSLHEEMVGLLN